MRHGQPRVPWPHLPTLRVKKKSGAGSCCFGAVGSNGVTCGSSWLNGDQAAPGIPRCRLEGSIWSRFGALGLRLDTEAQILSFFVAWVPSAANLLAVLEP